MNHFSAHPGVFTYILPPNKTMKAFEINGVRYHNTGMTRINQSVFIEQCFAFGGLGKGLELSINTLQKVR